MTLELTGDQALVLFEWLARLDERDAFPHEHVAEKHVLWQLCSQLERTLVEPLLPNYKELVAQARSRIEKES